MGLRKTRGTAHKRNTVRMGFGPILRVPLAILAIPIVTLGLASSVEAQPMPHPPINGPFIIPAGGDGQAPASAGTIGMSHSDAVAGGILEIAVTAESSSIDFLSLVFIWEEFLFNGTALTFIGWQPGAALESYAAETEDCDVFIYPLAEGFFATELDFYESTFQSDVHGSELLILQFATESEQIGQRTLLLADQWGRQALAEVEIVPSIPILKGDLNNDQVINFADPLLLLDFMFTHEPVLCPRAGDVDSNDLLNLGDAVYLLNYLFGGVAEPLSGICEPYAESGLLTCSQSSCGE